MDEIIGTSNRILDINISGKSWFVFEITAEEREMYLGGKGLAIKLLYDRLEPGIDPLGEKNILAIMPGVIMGSGAPCSGRFAAVSKSPLTNIMAASFCGGPFGIQLKTAGYDGLLIHGKSDRPCIIHIDHEKVEFQDGEPFWGLDTQTVQNRIVKKKNEAALVIGPAGENCVRFANIASGQRFLGRGGLGAVMGSKKLKGIIALGGKYRISPVNTRKFAKLKKKGNSYIKRNRISIAMGKFGTLTNIKPVNRAKMLPVWNFYFGNHDHAFRLSGELVKDKCSTEYHTCKPCSIMCGHRGQFRGKKTSVPEYETSVLLGSNLGIFDIDLVSYFNDICNYQGLDTISAGGTIAWVMEAGEKGYIKTPLRFGSPAGIASALNDIATNTGFGKEMALGSRALAEKYGGHEFAIQVKGLEMAGYDPRGSFGQGLSYAVANRGACHLSASLFPLEIFFNLLEPENPGAKPQFVKFFEDMTCGVNSIITCQFTMYSYILEAFLTKRTPHFLLKFIMQNLPRLAIALTDSSLYSDFFSAVTGIKMSSKKFLKAGERIHVLERYMNTREGITRKDDTLPNRMLHEIMPDDLKKRVVPMEDMLDSYYVQRGYNSHGIPSKATLEKLNIKNNK